MTEPPGASPNPSDTGVTSSGTKRDLRIGPEDTVKIDALNLEEISKPWRVSAAGVLNLPMAGEINVAGLTVGQLEEILKSRLRPYVLVPEVTVYIAESRSQPVTVTGSVARPGIVQLEGATRIFDAIMLAGGPKDAGATVTITRALERGSLSCPGAKPDPDRIHAFAELSLTHVMTGRGPEAECAVQPFDVISIAAPKPSQYVYISGEVNRAGSIELVNQTGVSLMKALAVAGGRRPTAGNLALIMHVNADGVQTLNEKIDVRKIESGKAKDYELTAGDVVIVPTSQWKSYLATASSSAMTSGIYGIMYTLARF